MTARLRALAGLVIAALVLATVVPCKAPIATTHSRTADHADHAAHGASVGHAGHASAHEAALVAPCFCGCRQRRDVAGSGGGLAPTLPSAATAWIAAPAGAAHPAADDIVAAAPAAGIDHVPRAS